MSDPDAPDGPVRPLSPAPAPVRDALHTARDAVDTTRAVVDTTRGVLDATRQAAGLARGATDPAALTTALGGAAQRAQRALEAVPGAEHARQALRTAGEVAQIAREASGVISSAMRTAGDLANALGGLGGGDRLLPVQYAFTSRGTPDAQWRVTHVEAREGLNELFRCVLDLASEHLDAEADLDALLGHDATFVMTRGEHDRRFCGVVADVTYAGVQDGRLYCNRCVKRRSSAAADAGPSLAA